VPSSTRKIARHSLEENVLRYRSLFTWLLRADGDVPERACAPGERRSERLVAEPQRAHDLDRTALRCGDRRGGEIHERVVDAIVRLVGFAADEERGLARAVVEERVARARPRRERGEIARLHRVEKTVDPGVHLAVEHVNELLLQRLGMRPGDAVARRNSLNVEPDLQEPGRASDRAGRCHRLVAVRVAVDRFADVGGGDDEGRTAQGGGHGAMVPRSPRRCRSRPGPAMMISIGVAPDVHTCDGEPERLLVVGRDAHPTGHEPVLHVLPAVQVASIARCLCIASLLVACGQSTSYSNPIPACLPSCPSSQVCMNVCHDGGAEDSECVIVEEGGGQYTAPDGGPVDVCGQF
jgi:hypothetical protein